MSRPFRVLLAAALLVGVPLVDALAQPAASHAPRKKKPGHEPKSQTGTFGVSNSLNAPSTDFSRVTPATGDDENQRGRGGPVVRPSIDSNGNPAMGIGF